MRCTIIKGAVQAYQKPKIEFVNIETIDVISASIENEDEAPMGPWISVYT